jgi:site-specific recombinase XerD
MHFKVSGKGRKGKKIRFVTVGPMAERLIHEYLKGAGHGVKILMGRFFVRSRITGADN